MGRFQDITNEPFGKLIARWRGKNSIQPSGQQKTTWVCECTCGNWVTIQVQSLLKSSSQSCGHCNDIYDGDRFGRLEVLCGTTVYHTPKTHKTQSQVICLCDCGNYTIVLEGNLKKGNLKKGNTQSCGHCKDIQIGDSLNQLEVLCWTSPHVNPKTKKKRSRIICLCDCGNYWVGLETSFKSGHTKSCGCYKLTGHMKENHYNWKGGITSLMYQIRHSLRYREWRMVVFIKHNRICQYSGQYNKNLQVHHIKPFHIILEENNITTLEQALACEELWDVENGITLSEEWHIGIQTYNPRAFHKLNGNVSFTDRDFWNWFNIKRHEEVRP